MSRFTNLHVWQHARELLRLVSDATASMTAEGDLKSQMRRAAIGIASNIAEGAQRGSDREFLRFLRIADGSIAEVRAQATIAADIGCLSSQQAQAVIDRAEVVGRMLNRLMARLSGSG